MMNQDVVQAILSLKEKGIAVREISRILRISRNTVRSVLRGKGHKRAQRASRYEELAPLIQETLRICKGNAVRVQEILQDTHGHEIPYSTLTRVVRDLELRQEARKKRSGTYHFEPGEETQHDTSPHQLEVGRKKMKAQCASLVLAYSKKLFFQYYPTFTRFEAKVFLREAFLFMDGACPRCTIDNTSVIVAHGSGPDAVIAPEMEHFGKIFGVKFIPHEVGDADRKARVERNFSYIDRNFLAGRTFRDCHDLNSQAKSWCIEVANRKVKRSLGMSPEAAYVMEKPYLQILPPYIPPVYQTLYRGVDVTGYVHVDTNRYSVPERLIGKEVEVHKLWDRIEIFWKQQKVADHERLIDKREARSTIKGHHLPLYRQRIRSGPCKEEMGLLGHSEPLDRYVEELKKRSPGRAVRQMRKLLSLKRTYPEKPFLQAMEQALQYGMYDLSRLEQMILSHVAGDFFNIKEDDET
jgi:transposase